MALLWQWCSLFLFLLIFLFCQRWEYMYWFLWVGYFSRMLFFLPPGHLGFFFFYSFSSIEQNDSSALLTTPLDLFNVLWRYAFTLRLWNIFIEKVCIFFFFFVLRVFHFLISSPCWRDVCREYLFDNEGGQNCNWCFFWFHYNVFWKATAFQFVFLFIFWAEDVRDIRDLFFVVVFL